MSRDSENHIYLCINIAKIATMIYTNSYREFVSIFFAQIMNDYSFK